MKKCAQCGQPFEIQDRDKEFYKKIAPTFDGIRFEIPEPTLCPLCRQQRRFAFRNERNLYRRRCNGSGKEIISMYSGESTLPIYAQDVWWQDNWDAADYGRDFDFNRGFFEQYAELMRAVPRIALLNFNSPNSEYCNFTGDVKNSYLVFGSVYCEDCYYGSPYYSKNCVDSLVIRECELCYECIDCRKLYNCLYCQDCNNSSDLLYCFDLQGCSDCIGCAGLRNKKYCIFNKQFGKEEYLQKKAALNLCDPASRATLQRELEKIKQIIPCKAMPALNSENVSGSHVFNSKNTFESFFADRCQDCSYCAQVVDLKDCFDNNYTEENELCYEYLGMYGSKRTFFSLFSRNTYETFYSDFCVNSKYLFGCSGLRNKEYCILNKQYSKESFDRLRMTIVKHMQKTGEWGEFFPIEISPFAYNETVAQEYFPLNKKDVEARGWRWKDQDAKEFQPQRITIPTDIKEVPDSICYEVLSCEITGRNFRIIPQELEFYRNMNLPVPRIHPDERHRLRITRRNPRRLWNRSCDKCGNSILTSYSPDTKMLVYCENCYLKTTY